MSTIHKPDPDDPLGYRAVYLGDVHLGYLKPHAGGGVSVCNVQKKQIGLADRLGLGAKKLVGRLTNDDRR